MSSCSAMTFEGSQTRLNEPPSTVQGWLEAALSAARATAVGPKDLREMRWQAFEVSWHASAKKSVLGSPPVNVLEEQESCLRMLSPLVQKVGRVHIGDCVRLLRQGQAGELATRLRRASSVRNGAAHPDADLRRDIEKFIVAAASEAASNMGALDEPAESKANDKVATASSTRQLAETEAKLAASVLEADKLAQSARAEMGRLREEHAAHIVEAEAHLAASRLETEDMEKTHADTLEQYKRAAAERDGLQEQCNDLDEKVESLKASLALDLKAIVDGVDRRAGAAGLSAGARLPLDKKIKKGKASGKGIRLNA